MVAYIISVGVKEEQWHPVPILMAHSLEDIWKYRQLNHIIREANQRGWKRVVTEESSEALGKICKHPERRGMATLRTESTHTGDKEER